MRSRGWGPHNGGKRKRRRKRRKRKKGGEGDLSFSPSFPPSLSPSLPSLPLLSYLCTSSQESPCKHTARRWLTTGNGHSPVRTAELLAYCNTIQSPALRLDQTLAWLLSTQNHVPRMTPALPFHSPLKCLPEKAQKSCHGDLLLVLANTW